MDKVKPSIYDRAVSVSEAMLTRHSIREFESQAIPEKVLKHIVEIALRTPSWKNSQPWNLHVITGYKRDELSKLLVQTATSQDPNPDAVWPENYPPHAKKRMFDLGMEIYSRAGIDRRDKQARDEFMLRNFSFFGAPAAIFVTTDFSLGLYTGIDIGCLVQSIMLLAREEGLGICAQAALSAFPSVIRNYLNLPEEQKVILGFSLGYPKSNSQLNEYHTSRETFDKIIHFYN